MDLWKKILAVVMWISWGISTVGIALGFVRGFNDLKASVLFWVLYGSLFFVHWVAFQWIAAWWDHQGGDE